MTGTAAIMPVSHRHEIVSAVIPRSRFRLPTAVLDPTSLAAVRALRSASP